MGWQDISKVVEEGELSIRIIDAAKLKSQKDLDALKESILACKEELRKAEETKANCLASTFNNCFTNFEYIELRSEFCLSLPLLE